MDRLHVIDTALAKLRAAVASMPDIAFDGQGYFAQWSTIGRHHLGEWIDDTSRVLRLAANDLSAAEDAGFGEDGAGSLESSLWRMYSALDKLMVVCGLIIGVRLVELSRNGKGVRWDINHPRPVVGRIRALAENEPTARALIGILDELRVVGGRSLRNQATHSLSPVVALRSVLDLDVRTIRAGTEVSRTARLLYPSSVLWDDADIRPETVWRRAVESANLTLNLMVRAVEVLADLTTAAGRLHPPELVHYDTERKRVMLPER